VEKAVLFYAQQAPSQQLIKPEPVVDEQESVIAELSIQ